MVVGLLNYGRKAKFVSTYRSEVRVHRRDFPPGQWTPGSAAVAHRQAFSWTIRRLPYHLPRDPVEFLMAVEPECVETFARMIKVHPDLIWQGIVEQFEKEQEREREREARAARLDEDMATLDGMGERLDRLQESYDRILGDVPGVQKDPEA